MRAGWVRFADRVDAGRRLGERLLHLRGADSIVLGLPRGGVPVAAAVADALGAPLDVVVVRKLGVPSQPELAMGALGEGGTVVLDRRLAARAGVTDEAVAAVVARERAELDRRVERLRRCRPPAPLTGRVAIVVDDGIATGSTARAACLVARARGARRVVVAVPVAPVGWHRRLDDVADELVAVATPDPFLAVGQFYDDFGQLDDEDVAAILGSRSPQGRDDEVCVPAGDARLAGRLAVPGSATGVVVFAHGSGSSRLSPRNRFVAEVLHDAGLATLLFDLLTPGEADDRRNVFDVDLLARRLRAGVDWVRRAGGTAGLPIGLFGASTGAAAALVAAAEPDLDVAAVVSRGGRPDLAGARLADVRAPTLLIAGGDDAQVLELNREALGRLRCPAELVVVPGATHLFEEPGALAAVAARARDWFLAHASPPTGRRPPDAGGRSGPHCA